MYNKGVLNLEGHNREVLLYILSEQYYDLVTSVVMYRVLMNYLQLFICSY